MSQTTVAKQSKHSHIVLEHIYQQYPFKKNFITASNVVPYPFVKAKEVTDTKNSLDFKQWNSIVKQYINLIKDSLIEGNKFKIPHKTGQLFFTFARCKSFVDKRKSNLEGHTVKFNAKTLNDGGVIFKLRWDTRYKGCSFPNVNMWKVLPVRNLLKQCYKQHDEDFTFVNRFVDMSI